MLIVCIIGILNLIGILSDGWSAIFFVGCFLLPFLIKWLFFTPKKKN
jgi:hypothetical protein